MAKAKRGEVDSERLCKAVIAARKVLRETRETRREMVRQYAGYHWGNESARREVPLNLIGLYAQIVGRNLFAKNPRVMLSTFDRQHKPTVNAMNRWANKEIERSGFADVMRRVVLDGLFSYGVCKVALATPQDASSQGWNLRAGTPFCDWIDMDDFVFDTFARDFNSCTFIGHRYRVPLSAAKDDRRFAAHRKNLIPTPVQDYNEEGDERIGHIGRGDEDAEEDEFEEHVDLWEIYLPRKRLVLTFASEDGANPDGEPLLVQEWVGPDCGPYHVLGFQIVPGNALPKGPIMDLIDQHEQINGMLRKLSRQAERQKDLLLVMNDEDVDRIKDANDGEAVRVHNPNGGQQVPFGGPNATLFAYFTAMKDLFSWQAGNLDSMGGLAPQAKTLGQDKMLSENASRTVADLQETTIAFTSRVLKAMCWYWWHDPFQTMQTVYQVEGLEEVSVNLEATPQDRAQVPFNSLEIKVDPYSMQFSTPQSRGAALNQLIQQIVLPALPLLQQQGITFNMQKFLEIMAGYLDMPDLQEVVSIQEPIQDRMEPAPEPDGPRMPQSSTREYVRHNRSERTPQATNSNLVASLMNVDMGGAPKGS